VAALAGRTQYPRLEQGHGRCIDSARPFLIDPSIHALRGLAAGGPTLEMCMMKNKLFSAGLLAATLLASTAAQAFHCPADMKKIDEAMAKSPKLSAEQLADVKRLRAEGEAFHKAGKHQESVDTLAKAMKILEIK
jgi:hypothetical protein